jgi:diguanylate cyclase (GGDEF)-like protein
MSVTATENLSILLIGRGREAIQRELAATGQTVVVEDFLQALGEMASRHVDLVVATDVPPPSEVEPTIRAIRELDPDTRLLLMTDPAHEPDAMAAVRQGFDDYLIEPIRSDELRDALAKIAAQSSALPVEVKPDPVPLPVPEGSELPLLQSLLSERGSLREQVVAELRKRFGEDLHWTAEPDLDARNCLPISQTSSHFGCLLSDSLDSSQLAAAATWAGHWLAVEQRILDLKHEANHDDLTDAWNRRYFDRFLEGIVQRAREQRFRVTLLLFDIDDFKRYNDEYGHPAGDEILREAARLMQTVVRRQDVVARIGGDEFGVIFWDAEAPRRDRSEHPRTARRAASRFQKAICDHKFPKLGDCAPGTLSISGGLASYPWDGQTPEELMKMADDALLESKCQGKNAITLGPGALRECGFAEDE